MAIFAAQNGKVDDALKLANSLESISNKTSLHAELFTRGRTESLQDVLRYLEAPESKYQVVSLQRTLARAGYEPAVQAVRERATSKPKRRQSADPVYDTHDRLEDLITLHATGDESAAGRVAELVRADPEYNLHYLGRVGLASERIVLAKQLHTTDPSPENEHHLLEAQHDNDLWLRVFRHLLIEGNNPWQASGYVRRLGRMAKAQEA